MKKTITSSEGLQGLTGLQRPYRFSTKVFQRLYRFFVFRIRKNTAFGGDFLSCLLQKQKSRLVATGRLFRANAKRLEISCL